MFWYRQYIFIASSLRRNPFIGKPLGIKAKRLQVKSFALAAIIFAASCREPFVPNIRPEQTNFLVVEGFINAQGVTNIALSRTTPLEDTGVIKPEQGADITIMGEDNSTSRLFEDTGGHYQSDFITLNKNQKYRLLIKTAEGKEYLSDYVDVKPTPAIDSVSWQNEDNGVRIYVNTHDPQNNTRYYKWEYEETWEIHSAYVNSVKYENGSVSTRDISEVDKLYYCWQSQNSVSILLGSSAQLENDVISKAPIMFIPDESEKISVRYSILVKQYSLDRKAYDFYKMMKSNTESLGSVFGTLPTDISGNITCISNPLEKVIGYVSVSTVDQKRIFISASDVHSTYNNKCGTVYVANNPDSFKVYYDSGGLLPYQADGFFPKGYYSSEPLCIDCTLKGTSTKPSFW